MIEKISETAQEIIDEYKHLNIRGIEVCTPYYRNVKRTRAELRSLIGKGTPAEIKEETIIFAQLRGVKIQNTTPAELKKFMESQGVGIDCSGFVAHTLNYWLKKKHHKTLASVIKFQPSNFYRKMVQWLRPIENMSANLLTGMLNADRVNYNEVHPGYLFRLKGIEQGHHIALITEVKREDETGRLLSFKYTHSTNHYENNNGVKDGEIIIVDNNKPLKVQHWTELDAQGSCPTKVQYMSKVADNGIVKPKFFDYLK